MKKPSKLEAFHKNLETQKADRIIPAVGVPVNLAIHEAHIDKLLLRNDEIWLEIGGTLLKIQEEKEYPEKTLEAYVKRRFNRTRDWAYKMIEAFQVKKALPENVESIIQNQAQALALKKAPKKERTAVLKEAEKQGDTSPKKIKEIAAKKTVEAEYREVIKDANGEEVPEAIAESFQRAEAEAKEQISNAQQIKNFLESDNILTVEARGLRETAKDLLAGLKTHLGKHVLCPKCGGKKCAVCSKRGFVSLHFATKGMGKK